jgi:hypothetical protein
VFGSVLKFLCEGSRKWLGVFVAISSFAIPAAVAETDFEHVDWNKERQFWAFTAPKTPERPAVRNQRWPREASDYFILAKLEEQRLSPAPEADKRTLLRRASYDLTGLPPSEDLAARFLTDSRPDAYARLVDELIATPAFGERMASMWLPLARYAEDQAHQVGSDTKFFYPNAYKYRKWVIDAFNCDLPYQDFVKLQLAADKLCGQDSENLAALGFLGLGPKYYNRNRLEVMADEWEDRVDTVTRTFLGLTVACARCHDHKFDPITREDYYGLAGVFASTKMINRGQEEPIDDSEKPLKNKEMSPKVIHMVEDGEAQDLNVFIRGNVNRKGPLAPRGFIRVLAREGQPAIKEGSGRKEIAEDIADWRNPLVARVIVNRVWTLMTGNAIVASPSNFGHSGQIPANQDLLDFLATRFMAQGGSIKRLAREIALSATYRQASVVSPKMISLDPANQLLGRMNRRRLTVEQWRDTVLYHSGELIREGGKSMELDDPKNFRRTVYARISRLQLNAVLMAMDYPDANVHAEKRAATTSAMQKLFQMNSEFMTAQAKAVAARIDCPEGRVQKIYWTMFNRAPDAEELKLAEIFLSQPRRMAVGATAGTGEAPVLPKGAAMSRWEEYVQALLISNELMYVD